MKKRSALVVEDDLELGEIFTELLEDGGLEPVWLQNGRQALDWLEDHVPDIIILDMHLPYVSGMDVLKYVRAKQSLSDSRVIVVTADALRAEVVTDQADLVLIKPVDYDQMLLLTERLLT